MGNNPINSSDPEGLFWPIDCAKCLYYRSKILDALDKCRSELARCKNLEEEVKFMEKYGSPFGDAALWNCAVQVTGDPKIWQDLTESCFKCGFLQSPGVPAPKKPPISLPGR